MYIFLPVGHLLSINQLSCTSIYCVHYACRKCFIAFCQSLFKLLLCTLTCILKSDLSCFCPRWSPLLCPCGATIYSQKASSSRPGMLSDIMLITCCTSFGNVVVCSCALLTFKPHGFLSESVRICLTCRRANSQPATIRPNLNAPQSIW